MRTAICCLLLILISCAHNPATLRPGAFNQFDQATHDVLRTTQATLEAAANDVRPLAVGHPLKVAYNAAIDAYNAAEKGYQAYHAALVAGKPADQAGVSALLQGLNSAVAAYAAAKSKPIPAGPAAWLLPSGSLQRAA